MRLLNELNKQFRTVSEKTDFIDKDEAEMDFQDLPDQDIDNDGETDASDKYLHKRLGTIAKMDENELGVKEPYYVEVSVRDAREVADILQDIGILKQLTRYGSNVFATKNEDVFQELMQVITDNEIELYSSSIDEMSTTAAVPGYQTPYAFGAADDDTYTQAGMELSKMMESKSSFKRMMAEMYGVGEVNERNTKLYVYATSKKDHQMISNWLERSDFHAEEDSNSFMFPVSDQRDADATERDLDKEFTKLGADARFVLEGRSQIKRKYGEHGAIRVNAEAPVLVRELIPMMESVSYREYKKDPNASPQQKVNKGIAEINAMLAEIEHMVQNNVRLKQEMGVNSSHFWKATGARFAKINERMTRISNRLRELSK